MASQTQKFQVYITGGLLKLFFFEDHQSQEKQLWTRGNEKKHLLYVSVMMISRETTVH